MTSDKARQRAEEIGALLGEVSDELTEALESAGQRLRELNLGVRATVEMSRADDASTGDTYYEILAFGKYDGKWGLWVESGPESGDLDDWNCVPLSRASREQRLRAATLLDALLAALLLEAERQVAEVVKARDDVRRFAQRVPVRGQT